MKRLLLLSIVFLSGFVLASCQSQPTPQVLSPVKPAASPVITTEDKSSEVMAIQDEMDKVNLKTDFQTFTDKDLQ